MSQGLPGPVGQMIRLTRWKRGRLRGGGAPYPPFYCGTAALGCVRPEVEGSFAGSATSAFGGSRPRAAVPHEDIKAGGGCATERRGRTLRSTPTFAIIVLCLLT